MTTPADDLAAERAFEASLAGRAVPDGAASLAVFTEAVRASATRPGRPNAALAELLATGLLTHQPSPSPRAVRKRPRMKILPLLAAKLTAGGGLAKAAVGTGVVLVALTGGLAVTTPSQLFGTVSESEGVQQEQTSEPQPDGSTDGTTATDADTTSTDTDTTSTDADTSASDEDADATLAEPVEPEISQEEWAEGPAEGQPFGAWVSQGARYGYVDGQTVSRHAHARNEARRAAREQAAQQAPAPAPAPDQAPEPADEPETQASAGTSGDGGPGGGEGSGGEGSGGEGSGGAGNGKGQGKK